MERTIDRYEKGHRMKNTPCENTYSSRKHELIGRTLSIGENIVELIMMSHPSENFTCEWRIS